MPLKKNNSKFTYSTYYLIKQLSVVSIYLKIIKLTPLVVIVYPPSSTR